MVSYIKIKDFKLNLNFEEQTSLNGRTIRLSGISKNLQKAPVWIDINGKSNLKYNWIYTFRYMDEQDGFVSFEYDFNDKFLCKL